MKFKDDPWLTDYITAIHFAVRLIETRTGDRHALYRLKQETDALVQEAILGNIPMDLFTIRRLAERIGRAEYHLASMSLIQERVSVPVSLKTYNGKDAHHLVADYHFIRNGYEEFTLRGMIGECSLYLPKIYPGIRDMAATVSELFERDIRGGTVEETGDGIYRHTIPAALPV